MTFLNKVTRFMTDFQPSIARNTNKTQPKLKKKEKFLNLDFAYVLPYCELSFCDRDHCRVSNESFLVRRLKFGLRFKKNVAWGMSNHGFINISKAFFSIWSKKGCSRFRWDSTKILDFFCQNRLIQVSKSRLKHRIYLPHPKSSRLKVDFCIQLPVKFQILIHFL